MHFPEGPSLNSTRELSSFHRSYRVVTLKKTGCHPPCAKNNGNLYLNPTTPIFQLVWEAPWKDLGIRKVSSITLRNVGKMRERNSVEDKIHSAARGTL